MISEITIYLARFWGSLFMILGVASIFGRFLGKVIKFTENKTITISTGYITFLLGLITVVLHSLWVMDWRVTITILGWTTLFKGIEKITLPGRVNKKAQMFKKLEWFWGLVIFFIGLWFFWMSFN
jgi:hypothetical protein